MLSSSFYLSVKFSLHIWNQESVGAHLIFSTSKIASLSQSFRKETCMYTYLILF